MRGSFMGSYNKNRAFSKDFGQKIVAAAQYEPKRSMSNSRLISTFFVLVAAIFLCFCSLFYIPSLTTAKNSVIGTLPSATYSSDRHKGYFDDFIRFIKINRGYFREEETIRVEYQLSEGMDVELKVLRCQQTPVLEIFMCQNPIIKSYTLEGLHGNKLIPVSENGFYYLREFIITSLPKNSPYYIKWGRGE